MAEHNKTKQHALVMWIIWFGILQGAFIIQILMGGGLPKGENVEEPMAIGLWALCFGPILVATGIRWLVIPKIQSAESQLTTMIIGLAMAEAPVFFSLFLVGSDYPQNQIAVLMVAIVGIIQFAPTYATPGYTQETESRPDE